jgi:hypothetical protein
MYIGVHTCVDSHYKTKGGLLAMTGEIVVVRVVMLPDGRMDVKNAALYAGLAQKTLAMLRHEGTGPKFIKRGRVFYYRCDLDEWLASGKVTSTAQARAANGA